MRKIWLAIFACLMSICTLTGCFLLDKEATPTLSATTLSLDIGQTKTVNVTNAAEFESITWSSSDIGIATVADGIIAGVSEGSVRITVMADGQTATVQVTVSGNSLFPVFTALEGYTTLTVDANQKDVDLTEGLSAKNKDGYELEIVIADMGGFQVGKLGEYTVKYTATDPFTNLSSTFERRVYATYYGIKLSTFEKMGSSNRFNWTYLGMNDTDRTANEWTQYVVDTSAEDWNRFESPTGTSGLVMHGSDTQGRRLNAAVYDNEDPNTLIYNKVTVDEYSHTFRVYCSNNPYPEFNNMLSTVRVSVIDPENGEITHLDYTELKAPLDSTGTQIDGDKMRSQTYVDFDLSDFAGQTVILCIEQDSAKDVYQREIFRLMGYEDFRIDTVIQATRDTLVVYSMQFYRASEKVDYSGLQLDNATVWGTNNETPESWGLRGDLEGKGKWGVVALNGADVEINFNADMGASLQIIARETEATRDDNVDIRADAVIMNKIIAGSYFELYVGTDTDETNVNMRLAIALNDGTEVSLLPMFFPEGYRLLGSDWGNIQKNQWTRGVKLNYDLSAYMGQEIVVMIEVDENYSEGQDGNCTLWFNRAETLNSLLTQEIAGFTANDWQSAKVDQTTVWGTESTKTSEWDFVNNAISKVRWHWYHTGNGTLENQSLVGKPLQSNLPAGEENGAVFTNKVKVALSNFALTVGTLSDSNCAKVRLSVILEDGVVKTLSPVHETSTNGWVNVQSLSGKKLDYNFMEFVGSQVTILIEQGGMSASSGLCLLQAAFVQNAEKVLWTIGDSVFHISHETVTSIATNIGHRPEINNLSGSSIAPCRMVNQCMVNLIKTGTFERRFEGAQQPDTIIIQRGCNDMYEYGTAHSTLLGDINSTDEKNTIMGAVNFCMDFFKRAYPNARIVWASPYFSAVIPQSAIEEYSVLLKQACENHDIEFFDLYREIGINKDNYTTFLYDGTHANDAGNKLIVNAWTKYLTQN